MNYIKHLTGFFEKVVYDYDLNPTHISLYISLFQYWNLNRFENPISITRDEVMRVSKIASYATYHKCMKELHEKGYIKYIPSYNPFKGSMVEVFDFSVNLKPVQKKFIKSLKNEQELNKQCTSDELALNKSCTSTEQALVSSINNTNIINSNKHDKLLKEEQSKNNENENNCFNDSPEEPKKKLREKKGTNEANSIPPDWENVLQFFKENNATEIDAQKFYNHFQSNGWLVGGKSKMKNWKAAASNWMLNSQKFNQNKNSLQANQLHISNSKDYAEPL